MGGLGNMESIFIDIGLYAGYLLMAITLVLALVFPLTSFIKNFKIGNSKIILASMASLAILLFICYYFSSDAVGSLNEKYNVSTVEFKLIGGGIVVSYFLFAASIIVAVYSAVNNKLK